MSAGSVLEVREVRADDAGAWKRLYRGYRDFYELADDDAVVERTWRWVSAGEHGLTGLVAVDDADEPVALANLRQFARPSSGRLGLYLDDLFTSPAARGRGAATTLLAAAASLAAERGANVVRWITAESNTTARRLSDAHATATPWVTYDMPPAEESAADD